MAHTAVMLEPSSVEDVLSISLLQVAASSKFTEGVGKLIAVVIVGSLFSAVCFISAASPGG
eukprot:3509751-Pyramimonas_sp.AAC.1